LNFKLSVETEILKKIIRLKDFTSIKEKKKLAALVIVEIDVVIANEKRLGLFFENHHLRLWAKGVINGTNYAVEAQNWYAKVK
jgi:hypothetical protein